MEGIFWFVFGAVVGMAVLPHLQRLADRVRRVLAELDQPSHSGHPGQARDPRHPRSWS